jgi:hypothetical protein
MLESIISIKTHRDYVFNIPQYKWVLRKKYKIYIYAQNMNPCRRQKNPAYQCNLGKRLFRDSYQGSTFILAHVLYR